jgi:hypothetical protein
MVGPPSITLTWSLIGSELHLSWNSVENAEDYWIYGASNFPFFEPGCAPGYDFRLVVLPQSTTTWSSPNGIGDPNNNWTYLVMAVDEVEAELARSNRVGEYDLEAEIP